MKEQVLQGLPAAGAPSPYLDKNAVAALLGVSKRTVENLMARRCLAYVRLSPRAIRFKRADVEAAMDSLRIGGGL